jgi:E3 ubiquitin-protein ligase RNF144
LSIDISVNEYCVLHLRMNLLQCMRFYVKFEIAEGAYDISCPDAQCPSKGVLHEEEIKRLAGDDLFEKHKKYRLNRGMSIIRVR